MNYIEIVNEYKDNIEYLDELKEYVDYCVSKLELSNVLFNIIIIDNDAIHEINRDYRKIDRPTDVITFALEDNKDSFDTKVRVLGDIYISYDKVISQAKEYGHSLKRELFFLATHGILHLLGYDHMNKNDEEKMFKLQKELLDNYGIKKD